MASRFILRNDGVRKVDWVYDAHSWDECSGTSWDFRYLEIDRVSFNQDVLSLDIVEYVELNTNRRLWNRRISAKLLSLLN